MAAIGHGEKMEWNSVDFWSWWTVLEWDSYVQRLARRGPIILGSFWAESIELNFEDLELCGGEGEKKTFAHLPDVPLWRKYFLSASGMILVDLESIWKWQRAGERICATEKAVSWVKMSFFSAHCQRSAQIRVGSPLEDTGFLCGHLFAPSGRLWLWGESVFSWKGRNIAG